LLSILRAFLMAPARGRGVTAWPACCRAVAAVWPAGSIIRLSVPGECVTCPSAVTACLLPSLASAPRRGTTRTRVC